MKPDIEALLIPFQADGARHDPNDLLLCDVSVFGTMDLSQASHVLIGCPQDHGVRRNQGRPGAAGGPAAVREVLYRLKPPQDGQARVADLGDIKVDGGLEDIHDRLQSVVAFALRAGKTAIVLGGGNDISFADGAALAEVYGEIACINIDAHLDIRQGPHRHSGTPYRNLLDNELLKPGNLFEFGIQPWANSIKYLDDAKEMGIRVTTLHEVRVRGAGDLWGPLMTSLPSLPLLAGLDMDAVRSAEAPGVSAPSPVGFAAEEILAFADGIRHHPRAVVFEISEVNPLFDRDGCTARLAALAVYTFLYGLR
jgi:formiminoglutamase